MTRAEFIRLARAGRLSLKRIHYYGRTKANILADIEAGKTIEGYELRALANRVYDDFRKVTAVSGSSFSLDGKSWLDIPQASLLSFSNNFIISYQPALTVLTTEEAATLNEWKKVESTEEYKQRAYADAVSDGSSTYWQEKSFFEKRKMQHLLGFEWNNGRKLNINECDRDNPFIVFDKNIKGAEVYSYEYKLD